MKVSSCQALEVRGLRNREQGEQSRDMQRCRSSRDLWQFWSSGDGIRKSLALRVRHSLVQGSLPSGLEGRGSLTVSPWSADLRWLELMTQGVAAFEMELIIPWRRLARVSLLRAWLESGISKDRGVTSFLQVFAYAVWASWRLLQKSCSELVPKAWTFLDLPSLSLQILLSFSLPLILSSFFQ